MRGRILGEEYLDTAQSCINVGMVYYKLKKYDNSLEYFNKALEIRKKICPENDSRIKEVSDRIKVLSERCL